MSHGQNSLYTALQLVNKKLSNACITPVKGVCPCWSPVGSAMALGNPYLVGRTKIAQVSIPILWEPPELPTFWSHIQNKAVVFSFLKIPQNDIGSCPGLYRGALVFTGGCLHSTLGLIGISCRGALYVSSIPVLRSRSQRFQLGTRSPGSCPANLESRVPYPGPSSASLPGGGRHTKLRSVRDGCGRPQQYC